MLPDTAASASRQVRLCILLLQEALDRVEVCLRVLGKPADPIIYAVDFGNLPSVPIPSTQHAQPQAAPSDAEDSRAPEDGLPSDDEADDTAPEELGDSTHEAQNRGGYRVPDLLGMMTCYAVILRAPCSIDSGSEFCTCG